MSLEKEVVKVLCDRYVQPVPHVVEIGREVIASMKESKSLYQCENCEREYYRQIRAGERSGI